MKKLIFLFAILLSLSTLSFAQEKAIITVPGRKIVPIDRPLPNTTHIDYVEIFEQPNFGGRVAKYAGPINPFTYPFTNKRNISLKIAPNHIAYVTFNDEFKSTAIFVGNHPNFGAQNHNDIISIHVVASGNYNVSLKGISLQIHNNDCKKIAGTVKVRLMEKLADGTFAPCPIINSNGILVTNQIREATVFSKSSLDGRELNGLRDYVINFDGKTIPIATNPLASNRPVINQIFVASQGALANGNLFLEVVPSLTLGHKSNDLADDYSSNIKILTADRDLINYSAVGTNFSTKAFVAKGNPNSNNGRATGVDYSIVKNIRIHFSK